MRQLEHIEVIEKRLWSAADTLRAKVIITAMQSNVDVIISICANFFYTRSTPCELWFLNRNKPKAHHDKVLIWKPLTANRSNWQRPSKRISRR